MFQFPCNSPKSSEILPRSPIWHNLNLISFITCPIISLISLSESILQIHKFINALKWLCNHKSVDDPRFPRPGVPTREGCVPICYLAIFFKKLHEYERNWTKGGVRIASVPLGIRHCESVLCKYDKIFHNSKKYTIPKSDNWCTTLSCTETTMHAEA